MAPQVDPSSLKDKTIIVTGSAQGIGLATAQHFASGGAYVTIADVQDVAGAKAAEDLTAKGYHASFVHCDTSNWESSVAAFKHAIAFGSNGTLDVAVLNAGIEGDRASLAHQVLAVPEPSLDSDAIPQRPSRRALAVNLLGVYDNTYLALHYMRLPSKTQTDAAPSKSIILTSSLAGYADFINTDYQAAKFGVRGLFRGLRQHSAALNVRLNLIAPYWIRTGITENFLPFLHSQGIQEGKGYSWASIDHVVDAMTRSATDETVAGKAFGVWPEGYADIGDDEEGNWAADALKKNAKIRRAVGDLLL